MVPNGRIPFRSAPGKSALATLLGALLPALVGIALAHAAPRQGDPLLKTDLLGVFAHPDDETGMASTLAAYALGQTSVVANVYITRGEGGGNMVGTQSGPALGLLRELELRQCLAILGVRDCHFLDQLDWAYTESASATLLKWGKEETLARLVRLVRALRPEVILTMNPAPHPGQHGHHQAAGVLATEAFTAAADPNRFPLQLSKEGLRVWQPRKLYYGGGSTGLVATIAVDHPLPSGETPGQVAGRALAHHRSQGFGNFGSAPWLQRPQKFTLVKSFVPVERAETDLLRGVGEVDLAPVIFASPAPPAVRVEFAPRPAVANYRRWAAEQQIEHIAASFDADLPVVRGEPNPVILEIVNASAGHLQETLALTLPDGWQVEPKRVPVRVPPGARHKVQLQVTPPPVAAGGVDLAASLVNGDEIVLAKAHLHPLPRARVARVHSALRLDSAETQWQSIPAIAIGPNDSWQGKVTDEADSSALFRLAHDGQTLFLQVEVKDDAVVSNINPDDIKGHWRSDSVEICFDPSGGAEHTLGAFKLGVFPFDSSGTVRAARDADANPGPVEETAPGTHLASWRTEAGYVIAAAIPWREIGRPAGSQRLGFNLLVYDGDKRDAARGENINESRLAWSPRPGVMGRPEDWGRIDLE